MADYSDYLGNAASALEIVEQYVGEDSDETLPAWCERQYFEIWPDSNANPDWDDVAADLVKCAAEVRVGRSDALGDYEDVILATDLPNRFDHHLWVATAPESEIVSWAVAVEAGA